MPSGVFVGLVATAFLALAGRGYQAHLYLAPFTPLLGGSIEACSKDDALAKECSGPSLASVMAAVRNGGRTLPDATFILPQMDRDSLVTKVHPRSWGVNLHSLSYYHLEYCISPTTFVTARQSVAFDDVVYEHSDNQKASLRPRVLDNVDFEPTNPLANAATAYTVHQRSRLGVIVSHVGVYDRTLADTVRNARESHDHIRRSRDAVGVVLLMYSDKPLNAYFTEWATQVHDAINDRDRLRVPASNHTVDRFWPDVVVVMMRGDTSPSTMPLKDTVMTNTAYAPENAYVVVLSSGAERLCKLTLDFDGPNPQWMLSGPPAIEKVHLMDAEGRVPAKWRPAFEADVPFFRTLAQEAGKADASQGIAKVGMPAEMNGVCSMGQCAASSFVADAMQEAMVVDMSFFGTAFVESPGFTAGTVTLVELYSVYRYENTLCYATLYGVTIIEMMNASLARNNFGSVTSDLRDRTLVMFSSNVRVHYLPTRAAPAERFLSFQFREADGQWSDLDPLRMYAVGSYEYYCRSQEPWRSFLSGQRKGETAARYLPNSLLVAAMGEYVRKRSGSFDGAAFKNDGRLVAVAEADPSAPAPGVAAMGRYVMNSDQCASRGQRFDPERRVCVDCPGGMEVKDGVCVEDRLPVGVLVGGGLAMLLLALCVAVGIGMLIWLVVLPWIRRGRCPQDPARPFTVICFAVQNESQMRERHQQKLTNVALQRLADTLVRVCRAHHCFVARQMHAHHMVVASDPARALRCAAALQRQLAEVEWERVLAARVPTKNRRAAARRRSSTNRGAPGRPGAGFNGPRMPLNVASGQSGSQIIVPLPSTARVGPLPVVRPVLSAGLWHGYGWIHRIDSGSKSEGRNFSDGVSEHSGTVSVGGVTLRFDGPVVELAMRTVDACLPGQILVPAPVARVASRQGATNLGGRLQSEPAVSTDLPSTLLALAAQPLPAPHGETSMSSTSAAHTGATHTISAADIVSSGRPGTVPSSHPLRVESLARSSSMKGSRPDCLSSIEMSGSGSPCAAAAVLRRKAQRRAQADAADGAAEVLAEAMLSVSDSLSDDAALAATCRAQVETGLHQFDPEGLAPVEFPAETGADDGRGDPDHRLLLGSVFGAVADEDMAMVALVNPSKSTSGSCSNPGGRTGSNHSAIASAPGGGSAGQFVGTSAAAMAFAGITGGPPPGTGPGGVGAALAQSRRVIGTHQRMADALENAKCGGLATRRVGVISVEVPAISGAASFYPRGQMQQEHLAALAGGNVVAVRAAHRDVVRKALRVAAEAARQSRLISMLDGVLLFGINLAGTTGAGQVPRVAGMEAQSIVTALRTAGYICTAGIATAVCPTGNAPPCGSAAVGSGDDEGDGSSSGDANGALATGVYGYVAQRAQFLSRSALRLLTASGGDASHSRARAAARVVLDLRRRSFAASESNGKQPATAVARRLFAEQALQGGQLLPPTDCGGEMVVATSADMIDDLQAHFPLQALDAFAWPEPCLPPAVRQQVQAAAGGAAASAAAGGFAPLHWASPMLINTDSASAQASATIGGVGQASSHSTHSASANTASNTETIVRRPRASASQQSGGSRRPSDNLGALQAWGADGPPQLPIDIRTSLLTRVHEPFARVGEFEGEGEWMYQFANKGTNPFAEANALFGAVAAAGGMATTLPKHQGLATTVATVVPAADPAKAGPLGALAAGGDNTAAAVRLGEVLSAVAAIPAATTTAVALALGSGSTMADMPRTAGTVLLSLGCDPLVIDMVKALNITQDEDAKPVKGGHQARRGGCLTLGSAVTAAGGSVAGRLSRLPQIAAALQPAWASLVSANAASIGKSPATQAPAAVAPSPDDLSFSLEQNAQRGRTAPAAAVVTAQQMSRRLDAYAAARTLVLTAPLSAGTVMACEAVAAESAAVARTAAAQLAGRLLDADGGATPDSASLQKTEALGRLLTVGM